MSIISNCVLPLLFVVSIRHGPEKKCCFLFAEKNPNKTKPKPTVCPPSPHALLATRPRGHFPFVCWQPWKMPPCASGSRQHSCSYSRGKSCTRCGDPPVAATAHSWRKAGRLRALAEAIEYFLQRRSKAIIIATLLTEHTLRNTLNVRPGWVGESTSDQSRRSRLQLQADILEQVCGGRVSVTREPVS